MKKWFQQITAFMVSFVMIASLANGAFASTTKNFTDVKTSDWFYTAVQYSVEHGMVSGTSDTTFSPAMTMSRGQFVTVIGRMDGVDTSAITNTGKFTDVKAGDYYERFVYWAASAGITSGTSDSTFGPGANVTREQMATFVARYLEYKGVTLPDSPNAAAPFNDAGSVSSYAQNSVEMLRKCGLLAGSGGNVNPKSNLSNGKYQKLSIKINVTVVEKQDDGTIPCEAIATTINPTSIYVGDTARIGATYTPGNTTDTALKYASGNTSIAIVDSNGTVTGVAPGTVKIYTYLVSDSTRVHTYMKMFRQPVIHPKRHPGIAMLHPAQFVGAEICSLCKCRLRHAFTDPQKDNDIAGIIGGLFLVVCFSLCFLHLYLLSCCCSAAQGCTVRRLRR